MGVQEELLFRNVALAHLMMESGAFPPRTSIDDTLRLYLQAYPMTGNHGFQDMELLSRL